MPARETIALASARRPFDLLCVGEIVIDLRSETPTPSLREADTFRRFLGGAPVNVARNARRLGGRVALVGALGEDELGDWASNRLQQEEIDITQVVRSPRPTTLILITRHTATPHFLAYRGADADLFPSQGMLALAAQARVVHTTAFALSQAPSRNTVLRVLQAARDHHCLVSFDPNFHPLLCDDRDATLEALAQAVSLAHIVKPSGDDCYRLFGDVSPDACVHHFLDWGATHVFMTHGPQGVLWVSQAGDHVHIPASSVPVADVTGAGDAFWAGLLMGVLDGLPFPDAALIGQQVAERTIQSLESVVPPTDRRRLYQTLGHQQRR